MGYRSNSDFRQTINIIDDFTHPGYDPIGLSYDFKVVKLNGEATDPYIIELNADRNVPNVTETLTVMGVGDSNQNSGIGSPPGFEVHGSIVNLRTNTECEATRGLSASYKDSIYDSMLCAARGGPQLQVSAANACNGDGGGPLLAINFANVKGDDDVGVQVGVVSWGYDSCVSGNYFPRVYSRVSSGYPWIRYIVCTEAANPPASFGCSGNEQAPPVPEKPSPPAVNNPISFRYTITLLY